jgi:hypothetical protein
MSIYCSHPGIDGAFCSDRSRPITDDDPPGNDDGSVFMAVMTDGDSFHVKTEPCTGCEECGPGAPWVYDGSNRMPTVDGPRGGGVDLASIATFLPTTKERAAGLTYVDDREWATREDARPPEHPWLRFGVRDHEDGDATVILSADQVRFLRDQLNEWLDHGFLPLDEYETPPDPR